MKRIVTLLSAGTLAATGMMIGGNPVRASTTPPQDTCTVAYQGHTYTFRTYNDYQEDFAEAHGATCTGPIA